MDKAALRQAQLDRLRAVPLEQRAQWSAEIIQQLISWPVFQAAIRILVYAPLANEPDLLPLLDHPAAKGKTFAMPRVNGTMLDLHHITNADQLIRPSNWLREPDPARCPLVSLAEIQLILIPALAFDPATGIRLGRGGGYYDRMLADPAFRGATAGVCFPISLIANIPREPHDTPMHDLVSPDAIRKINNPNIHGDS